MQQELLSHSFQFQRLSENESIKYQLAIVFFKSFYEILLNENY
jgi:hypothetical protein